MYMKDVQEAEKLFDETYSLIKCRMGVDVCRSGWWEEKRTTESYC